MSRLARPDCGQSRNEAEKELKKWNEDHEIEHKRAWEEEQRLKALTREMERVQLQEQSRWRGGQVAKWHHTELTGAKVWKGKSGGIDWYRYQK